MKLIINGTDCSSLVSISGLGWKESDIHSQDSGRDLAGVMHITVIGTKVNLSVGCNALNETNARTLLSVIKATPPLSVTYDDPATGAEKTGNFYCGDRNCEFLMQISGVKWWKNIKFDLIEC